MRVCLLQDAQRRVIQLYKSAFCAIVNRMKPNPWYFVGIAVGVVNLLAACIGAYVYGIHYNAMWVHSLILAIAAVWVWALRPFKK